MGITQLPAAPTPTAKGSIVVGTGTGSALLPVSSTNGIPLVTDSTQTTGLKYAATGKTWTGYSTPSFASLSGARSDQTAGFASTKVYYLGGYYIFGTSNGVIGYSTDAKTWNYQVIFPANQRVRAIAFNGTTWVVGGVNNYLYSSTTLGGTWTARTSQLVGTSTIFDIIWVAGSINLFILNGDAGGSINALSSSSDGITWTGRLSPTNGIRSIAVNTAQTVIIAGNQLSVANQQAYYSTNGTSWTFAPVYNSASDVGYIWYMPHVDKFAALTSIVVRRASASVSTQWDTVTYEAQNRPSFLIQTNPSENNLNRVLPIWDSVNSKYYVLDNPSNGPQPYTTLLTYGATDVYTRFTTGSNNRYGFALEKIETIPSATATAPSTTPDIEQISSLGYGNGIWVVVSGNSSLNLSVNLGLTVFSTAV
jgi:hypothetical protein